MKSLFITLVIVLVAGLLWIRYAPTNRDLVHMDPAEVDDPGDRGWRMVGLDAPRFPGEPTDVLEVFTEIALGEPRVRRLDGDVDEGMMTFVARTKHLGLRDYVTAKAVREGAVTKLAIISRSRYNFGSDWGVNRERLDRWLAEMELRLGKG